ncbi:MAG: uracil-DNA glycosylase [Athalassotoga sp.]|uniref:uracil-DNA glycosylase n=1 Tax=Athalassotoga sp. TaxID=2022597 RepID=UPI003D01291E
MKDEKKDEKFMKVIEEKVSVCTACQLSQTRTNVVVGEGNIHSPIVFVGEGPGEDEDLSGRPFVGRAGQLFDKILESAGFVRKDLYITNVVKCRPPGNRTPYTEEILACSHFLMAQIAIINPQIIVTLGATALNFFINGSITESRGKFFEWKGNIRIFPMFHPSYLLRNQSKEPGSPKALTWDDIRVLKKAYDEIVTSNA